MRIEQPWCVNGVRLELFNVLTDGGAEVSQDLGQCAIAKSEKNGRGSAEDARSPKGVLLAAFTYFSWL